MKLQELHDKKIAILGLGVEGIATAEYFLEHGISFSVFDEKAEEDLAKTEGWREFEAKLSKHTIPVSLGKWDSDAIRQFNVIVRSPGISLHKDYLQNLSPTTVITSQTKLFFDNCLAKIIGVTGTKGKGTTSSLIYEMLKKAGFDAYLGGNIGRPPIEFLDTTNAQSVVVLELSSFQLEDIQKSPHISVMLMVTQEHLDAYGNQNYHKSLEEYVGAKRNIVAFQQADDMAVLNVDYEASKNSADKTSAKVAYVSRYQEVENGCFVRDNKVILRSNGQESEVIDVTDILLPGAHNLENVCAAVMAASFAGVSIPDIAYILKTFQGLEHRLELVRAINGVRYYDDSFSTVPETAIAAISAFTQPEIVILGGSGKKSDFTQLGKLLSGPTNVKAVIGIGVEWPVVKSKIKNPKFQIVEGLKDMESIVAAARELSKPGDVVLLSPACASFDMFANYKDRGEQFKKAVHAL